MAGRSEIFVTAGGADLGGGGATGGGAGSDGTYCGATGHPHGWHSACPHRLEEHPVAASAAARAVATVIRIGLTLLCSMWGTLISAAACGTVLALGVCVELCFRVISVDAGCRSPPPWSQTVKAGGARHSFLSERALASIGKCGPDRASLRTCRSVKGGLIGTIAALRPAASLQSGGPGKALVRVALD